MLGFALRSILAQTYEDFDVLVWNDGGVPMVGVVAELSDPRVRYHHHPDNLGVAHAVAAQMQATNGELIAHMDDDDEWEPTFLERQVKLLDTYPTAALAFCDHSILNEDGEHDERSSVENSRRWGRLDLTPGLHEPAFVLAYRGAIPIASAAVFRRAGVDLADFPEALSYAWDRWLCYLITRTGRGIVYEPRRLARKRRHPAQMGRSVATTNNLTDLVIAYERLWDDRSFRVDRVDLARRLSDANANLAVALMRDGERVRAIAAARRSLNVRRSPRGAVALVAAGLPASIGRALAVGASATLARWRQLTQASVIGQGR